MSVDMTSRRLIKGSVVALFLTLLTELSAQSLQDGVDLVTTKTNDLVSGLLGSLASKQENVIVGPYGILSNLGMALEASNGTSREEILGAIGVSEEDVAVMRIGFKAYCDLFLEHSSNSEAAGAFNTVLVHAASPLHTDFIHALATFYCANITSGTDQSSSISFESHAGVMSHWKNYEKLAVYTFLSQQALRPFNKKNGLSTLVPMVPLVGLFRTAIWERAQVVILPVESNMVNFMIIMPNNPKHINTLAKSINNKSLVRLFETLNHEELEVFLPQLTIVSKKFNFTPLLKNFGISQVFESNRADLSKATSESAFLQNVTQDAYFSTSFVSINSVAGVSTGLKINRRRKRNTSKLYFNQPYLFFVLHKDTNLVLLAGKVESPIQVPS